MENSGKGSKPRALEGIRVLDLTRRYPTAHATMCLADFGAEVIKVDGPGATIAMPPTDTSTEHFAAHYPFDRNKKSMVLNLKTEGGRQVFYTLVKTADVLLEGFGPGATERLKIDYETLRAINPRLIYCSTTGFGPSGPYAHQPAHDSNYCAIGGMLSLIGEKDGQPYTASNFLADFGGAALHATVGILLALMARNNTGRGQFVDVSYLDSLMDLMHFELFRYFSTGQVPRRGETPNTGALPYGQILRCRDGKYFTVECSELHFWQNLCETLGREDLIPLREVEGEKAQEVIAELRKIFLTRTRDEWWELLKDKNTCVAPVLELDETFQNPQVLHRQMLFETEHPRVGKVRQLGIPIKLSDTPGEIRELGVMQGTHTTEVLRDLGLSDDEIAKLKQEGVLG